jgi:hypothetical protein
MNRAPGGILGGGAKTVAAVASTGAAVVSILSFLNGWGFLGGPKEQVANFGAKWIGVKPSVDTARAIGDTLHLAATITDKNGSLIPGVRATWTTENPSVATVSQDGSVVARGAGATTIIALIGELAARSRVVVHQTVAVVRIAGDSSISMAEGDTRVAEARGFDRRGYAIPPRAAIWKAAEGSAVSVDSSGTITATDVGRAILNVSVDGVGAQTLVNVVPAPSAITLVSGDGQRAIAGSPLRDRLIVRVVNRRGRPVEGTLVRFRVDPGNGVVDPAAVVTDVDGRARTAWTLSDRPGRQRAVASVERVDSTVTVVSEAEPIAANTQFVALTDSLSGVVGSSVDHDVGVRLTDSSGRALPDVPVTWSAVDGAKVEPIDERTDSTGHARVKWTLGPKVGVSRLRARVAGGVQPVTLSAVARPANPFKVELQRSKSKADDDARNVAVVATVKDTFGNVVPGAAIRLAPRVGTVAAPTVETDSLGRANTVWSLAAKSGDQQLVASVRNGAAADTLIAQAPATPTAFKAKQAGRPRKPST